MPTQLVEHTARSTSRLCSLVPFRPVRRSSHYFDLDYVEVRTRMMVTFPPKELRALMIVTTTCTVDGRIELTVCTGPGSHLTEITNTHGVTHLPNIVFYSHVCYLTVEKSDIHHIYRVTLHSPSQGAPAPMYWSCAASFGWLFSVSAERDLAVVIPTGAAPTSLGTCSSRWRHSTSSLSVSSRSTPINPRNFPTS